MLGSKINGVYRCKREENKYGEIIEDKKIFYRLASRNGHSTLLNDSSGRWIVIHDNQVLAYCELSGLDLADPCDAKRWYISHSSECSSSYSVQLSVVLKRADDKDLLLCQRQRIRKKPSKRPSKKPSPLSDLYELSTESEPTNNRSTESLCETKQATDAPRKQFSLFTFSEGANHAGHPIKKKITPYMKALRKLQSRKEQEKAKELEPISIHW